MKDETFTAKKDVQLQTSQYLKTLSIMQLCEPALGLYKSFQVKAIAKVQNESFRGCLWVSQCL